MVIVFNIQLVISVFVSVYSVGAALHYDHQDTSPLCPDHLNLLDILHTRVSARAPVTRNGQDLTKLSFLSTLVISLLLPADHPVQC